MKLYTILQLGILLSIALVIFYLYSIRLINTTDVYEEDFEEAEHEITTETVSFKKCLYHKLSIYFINN